MDGMSKIGVRAVALAVLVSAIVFGCSPAESPTATGPAGDGGTEQAAGPPKRGGVFVKSAANSSYSGMDPAMGQMSYNWTPLISLYMMKREPNTWEVHGDGIERWEFSKDGKELTLYLRKGVKFFNKPPVNGREVEARDVVYSLKSMTGQLYPDLPAVRFPRKSNLDAMADAVAVDKYTVKITLAYADPFFLDGLAEYRSAVILPENIRESFGGVDSLAEPAVDRYIMAGPFIPTKFVQLNEIEYKRNPDYWMPDQPYLDGIKEIFIAEPTTERAAFIAGQLDYIAGGNPEQRDFVISSRPDAQVVNYGPPSCWNRLAMNNQAKPFDDVRVRKAISLVVDRVEIGQAMRGEYQGKPLWKLPGPIPWVFPESLTQEELAKFPEYEHPKSQATIQMARKLLEEAGYKNGLEFEMMGATSSVRDWGVIAQSQIEKALPGVKIKLTPLDNAVNQNRAAKGDFQMQAYCYIHESNGLAMLKTVAHSTGGRNHAYIRDAKMDKLIDDASRELDPDKRKAILKEAQLYFLEVAPYVPSYHTEVQDILQPWVRNLRLGPASRQWPWMQDVWFTSVPKR